MIPVDDIEGLKVLITGGSSGIGVAAAKALAACGAELCIHANRNIANADVLAKELSTGGATVHVVSGDVTSAQEVADLTGTAIERLGGLDCLINNAGAIERTAIADVDDDLYDRVFDLNTRSILRMVRHSIGALEASSRASIINVGSIAGRNGGAPGSGVYAAAKAAAHSLTRSLAKELAPNGVRVNAIAPGVIKTPFHDATPAETLEATRKMIPLGRLGTSEDCGWTFVFLASSTMSGYVTGQVIDINGGQLMP